MWEALLGALGLMLVLEGIAPFLTPARTREALRLAAELDDATFRVIGLASMLLGALILYLLRS